MLSVLDFKNYARLLTGNNFDADDLVQEVALKLLENKKGIINSAAYIKKVMYTSFIDSKRKFKRSKVELVEDFPDSESETRNRLEEIENRESIIEAVRKFRDYKSTDAVDVFIMNKIMGIPHNKIAEIMGIKLSTSMIRLYRFNKKFKIHDKKRGKNSN